MPVGGISEEDVEQAARAPKIIDGLEERRDIDVAFRGEAFAAGAPAEQPGLLGQKQYLEHVADRVGEADDVTANHVGAEAHLAFPHDAENIDGLLRPLWKRHYRADQWPRLHQDLREKLDLVAFVQLRVWLRKHPEGGKDVGERAFVLLAVLPYVELGQPETKGLGLEYQFREQAAVGQGGALVGAQAVADQFQVGDKGGGRRIGRFRRSSLRERRPTCGAVAARRTRA